MSDNPNIPIEQKDEELISPNIEIIDSNISKIDEDITENKEIIDKEILWNSVGFHRILGGIFYPYILIIVGSILSLAAVSFIVEFKPYPEIEGYAAMTGSVLGFWFGLMDLNLGGGGGLSGGMNRFIGQYADTDPRRAMHYIQFYIWFQMWTGILQVTVIAIVTFTYFVNSALAYLSFFILAKSMSQYPGMLMVMESALQSFQRGDKTAWLSWLQDTVFQVTINVIFLLIGNAWGMSDPAIGRIVGITVFWILAQFIDDWLNLLVGAKMFGSVMAQRGIPHGFRELMTPRFNKEVIKECLSFTGKQWIGGQIRGIIGYFVGLYLIVRMPQMGTWTGLMLIPAFLGHLVSMVPIGRTAIPAISEAYNNGKIELARYFIHDVFKYYSFITLFMAVPLALFAPRILQTVMEADFVMALENYEAGLIMIPFIMLRDGTNVLRGFWSEIFVACNKPMPPIYIDYIFTIPGYLFQFLFIYLCIDVAIFPVWFLLIMPGLINGTLSMIVGYAWLQKTTIKIGYKEMFMQAVGAHLLASVCYGLCLMIFQYTLWDLIDMLFVAIFGPIGLLVVSLFILLSCLFLFPALFYCPFYALFGGWDDFTIEELRKTSHISGPSKFMVSILYKISNKFHKISIWGNKFPIADYDKIKEQLADLVAEGKANKLLLKKLREEQ